MYRLFTVEQVRELERRAIEEFNVSPKRLMKEAGKALAEYVQATVEQGPVAVICGGGNNGGDGWAAARYLHRRGRSVKVFSLHDPLELPGIAGEVAYETTSRGVAWEHCSEPPTAEKLQKYEVIVDCLLGIGGRLPLDEPLVSWCDAINASGVDVISADIPTGVDGNTGVADQSAIRAQATVTFIGAKIGLAIGAGAFHAGNVMVVDLDVDATLSLDFVGVPELWADEEYASGLPFPAHDANKYTRGRLLVIAGSTSYYGAAVMATLAATRCGAGYVTLAAPEAAAKIARSHLLTSPVVELPEHKDGTLSPRALDAVLELMNRHDAVVIGPGLGRNDKTYAFIRALVEQSSIPVILDADGINAYEGYYHELVASETSLVLTPHNGEMARLLGTTTEEVVADALGSCARIVGPRRTVVLKGPSTVIACQNKILVDIHGPSTLASAGTGDVLAGMIGSLVAQRLDPHFAAALAVRLQARAAQMATQEMTPLCMCALDVIEALPDAVRSLVDELAMEEED